MENKNTSAFERAQKAAENAQKEKQNIDDYLADNSSEPEQEDESRASLLDQKVAENQERIIKAKPADPAQDALSAHIKAAQAQGSQNNTNRNISESSIFTILGIISGVLSIIFGIMVNSMDTGSFKSYIEYNGDAYTGMQNAAAQAATNIKYLAEILKTGMSYLLIVFGLALICYFAFKLVKGKN